MQCNFVGTRTKTDLFFIPYCHLYFDNRNVCISMVMVVPSAAMYTHRHTHIYIPET